MARNTITVEFGDISSARQLRNRDDIRGFLAEKDSGREKTVRLKEGTPDTVVQELRGEAADSRKGEAEKYGQVALTESEREQIDFTETSVPAARSAKAIAIGKGVDDFVSFFDETLTVDEHREVFDDAVRDERGQRGGRTRDDEHELQQRLARAHNQVKQNQLPRAKDAAFSGDDEAQEFVLDEVGGIGGFEVSFSREDSGRLRGSGADFERLEDVHESRSERAQTLDEKQTAPVTLNPFAWRERPDKLDYPGIDTVDPARLHEQRSARAKEVDENEAAPIADSKQQWAMHPDKYDWVGVDTPGANFDDPTTGSTVKRDRRVPEQPSFERDTSAPEALTAELRNTDISLAPEEAFEGVATDSQLGADYETIPADNSDLPEFVGGQDG